MTTTKEVHIPVSGFLRLSQIIGNPKANPPIAPLIPIGRSTWWQWVREGKAPAPVKLGPRTTAWQAEQVLALVKALSAGCGNTNQS